MREHDSQQNPSACLLSEMRQVLAEMSLLQYGKTQAFDASGGKSENPDPRPSGESWTLEDKWRDVWQHAPTHATLEAARAELRAWKVREAPAETDGTTEDDWILEKQGYSAEQVARYFNTTVTRVRRLRLREKRDSEFGMPTEFPEARAPDARERVLNLARQGCTIRQIEMQTGAKRETVRRWLKDAA